MNLCIWKFAVQPEDSFKVTMPKGAKVLSVATQHGAPMMWALVDADAAPVERRVHVFGTGHAVPASVAMGSEFAGTFQLHGGALVFHVFVEGERRS